MEKIVLVGGGGQCKVVIDIIKQMGNYEIVGICDRSVGEKVLGIPIIGDDDALPKLFDDGVKNAFVCIGAISNPKKRTEIQELLKCIGFKLPALIHPKSIIGSEVTIGDGTCVLGGAIINACSEIDELCIINTGAIVEHDCVIGKNTHISPGACLCGGVKVGHNTHVGAGTTINQLVRIGNNVTIGSGSVVIKDIRDNCLSVGVPSKIIKEW